jgi:hypothetical protein
MSLPDLARAQRRFTAGRIPRIGLRELTAAAPVLRDRGEPHIADGLEDVAVAFCTALAEHRRSTAYRGRLTPPVDLGLEPLLVELHGAADVLDSGDDEALAVAKGCRALAHRLEALLRPADPDRVLVLVSADRLGLGELLAASNPKYRDPHHVPVAEPDEDTMLYRR